MTALLHFGFIIAYGIAAYLLAVALPGAAGMTAFQGAAVAGGAFLAVLAAHQFIAARRAVRELGEELDELRDDGADVQEEISELRASVAALKQATDNREDEAGRLVAEMRVLQGLLAQLNAKSAGKRLTGSPATKPAAMRNLMSPDAKIEKVAPVAAVASGLSDDAILEITQAALSENRIDLYLQPVVSLPQRKVKFYETFSRLRDGEGTLILPEQYIPVAVEAGLISTIDNMLLFRCVQLIRRARKDNVDVGFFCNVSSHSLNDADFFGQFVEYMEHNGELAGNIIFELSEADLSLPGLDGNLAQLAKLGFSFSVDQVGDLGIDYVALAKRNFRYVKISAAAIIAQTKSSSGEINVADLRESMQRASVSLIADRVEDEQSVVDLLECDVAFGQGFLFGEPRAARESG